MTRITTRETWQVKAAAIRKQEAAAGWVDVTQADIEMACEGRTVFDGCLSGYLEEMLGADNVKHISGINWFKREGMEPSMEAVIALSRR